MTAQIIVLAYELAALLREACHRCEVAGSVRRGKEAPKDIELVCIPELYTEEHHDMFGHVVATAHRNRLFDRLAWLYAEGEWALDTTTPRDGERYKRLRHEPSGICCDLFIADERNWGNIFAIRTGPGDFSKALVTRALRLGLKQDGGRLWRLHRDGTRTVVDCPEEADYFAALRVAYLEPHERTVDAIRATATAADYQRDSEERYQRAYPQRPA